jgi:hypothetical protein
MSQERATTGVIGWEYSTLLHICNKQFRGLDLYANTRRIRVVVLTNTQERKMNQFDAVGIAEGWIEAESEEQSLEAWQYLIDTGLAWRLQGWFGRVAADLIEQGICLPAKRPKSKEVVDPSTFEPALF